MKSSALVRDSLSVLQRANNGRRRASSFVQANEKNKFSLHGFRFLFNPSRTSLPLADCSFCQLSDFSLNSGPRGTFDVTYDTKERVISLSLSAKSPFIVFSEPIVSLTIFLLQHAEQSEKPLFRNAFAYRRSLICVTIKYQHPSRLVLSRLHAAKIFAEGGAQK